MKKTKTKFVSPVKVLKKIVVGLKSVQMEEYPRKPDSFDLNELSDSGLGEQIIEFFSTLLIIWIKKVFTFGTYSL